jgi:hypothetical protein
MHLELCARHCFLKKSQSDKCHVKMPKLCSTQLQVMHFLSPTCNSLQVYKIWVSRALILLYSLKPRGGDILNRKSQYPELLDMCTCVG